MISGYQLVSLHDVWLSVGFASVMSGYQLVLLPKCLVISWFLFPVMSGYQLVFIHVISGYQVIFLPVICGLSVGFSYCGVY